MPFDPWHPVAVGSLAMAFAVHSTKGIGKLCKHLPDCMACVFNCVTANRLEHQ